MQTGRQRIFSCHCPYLPGASHAHQGKGLPFLDRHAKLYAGRWGGGLSTCSCRPPGAGGDEGNGAKSKGARSSKKGAPKAAAGAGSGGGAAKPPKVLTLGARLNKMLFSWLDAKVKVRLRGGAAGQGGVTAGASAGAYGRCPWLLWA